MSKEKSKKNKWLQAEIESCSLLDMAHAGGPGRPDCVADGRIVEVKDYKRKLNRGDIARILDKPWVRDRALAIVSTSGFSAGAVDFAMEFDAVELFHKRGKRLHQVPDNGSDEELNSVVALVGIGVMAFLGLIGVLAKAAQVRRAYN